MPVDSECVSLTLTHRDSIMASNVYGIVVSMYELSGAIDKSHRRENG